MYVPNIYSIIKESKKRNQISMLNNGETPTTEQLIQIHEEYNEWCNTCVVQDNALLRQWAQQISDETVMGMTSIALSAQQELCKRLLAESFPVVEPSIPYSGAHMDAYCLSFPSSRECREYDC